jgi:AraC-like DNA-binding protein
VLGPVARDLQEQLRSATTWPARFALLDRCLGDRLAPDRSPPAEVAQAWRLLMRSRGTRTVRSIARDVGWSERHLANQFRTEIGLTPKVAARVIRFDRAKRLVRNTAGADVAARCGYADQSHLIRDFVAFTGLSPRAWLAAEFGNLQATPTDATAGWES